MSKAKIHMLFPTPVFECHINDYKEINLDLTKYIHELRERDNKGLKLSNERGWHSNYFEIAKVDVLKKFVSKIYPFLFEITKERFGWDVTPEKIRIAAMWSIINNKGSHNTRHFHPNCHLSAAYYVKAREKCGNIKFFDPTDQKLMQSPTRKKRTVLSAEHASFTPVEGDLLIFPSYLHHAVGENLSEEERIVISFNIQILSNI